LSPKTWAQKPSPESSCRGTRKQRTIPATLSGTGKNVTITDDYWYSEDLKVYLVLKHNDPRTGEQVVGILDLDRKEPDAAVFRIPQEYKVVDETPVEQQAKRRALTGFGEQQTYP